MRGRLEGSIVHSYSYRVYRVSEILPRDLWGFLRICEDIGLKGSSLGKIWAHGEVARGLYILETV